MSVHTKIIGLAGGYGVGKSTAAKHLVESYGAKTYTLAKPLKEIAKRTLDFTDDQMYGTGKDVVDPRYGFTPRHFLQRLGTEGVRDVLGQDFWVEYLLGCIERDGTGLIVIDDVRFLNEAAALRRWADSNWRFRYVYIWRLEAPWREEQPGSTHKSEAEWMRIRHDVCIAPDKKDLDLFHSLIDQACSDMFARKALPQ